LKGSNALSFAAYFTSKISLQLSEFSFHWMFIVLSFDKFIHLTKVCTYVMYLS